MYTLTQIKRDVREWLKQYPDYTRREAIEAVAEHVADARYIADYRREQAGLEARYEGSTFCRASR